MSLEEMMNEHGWDETELNGTNRYVTRDEFGRAVVGPVKHGKGRRRSLLGRLRRKERVVTLDSHAETVVIDTEGVETITEAKLHDRDFHQAVRYVAVDLLTWSFCLSLGAVCVKVAWMVVGL